MAHGPREGRAREGIVVRPMLFLAAVLAALVGAYAVFTVGSERTDAANMQGYKKCIRRCQAVCLARTPQCTRVKTRCMRRCSQFLR